MMNARQVQTESHFAATAEPLPLKSWLHALALPRLTEIEVDVTLFRNVRLRSPACCVVRGLLGEGLRRQHCLTRAPSCDGCQVWHDCGYATVFGTGSGPRAAAGGLADLHPFWLQGVPATHELAAGTRLAARLIIAGVSDPMMQSLHVAFRDAVEVLGETDRHRGAAAPQVSASRASRRSIAIEAREADTWWIEARTPLLLPPARGDTHLPSCPQAPWLPVLLGAGIRRLKSLACSFGAGRGSSLEARVPHVALPDLQEVEIASGGMMPWNGHVVSRRQGRAFPLEHGLIGGALLRGSALEDVGPLLRALAVTGVGKKTTMGFGHLTAEAVR